MTNPWELKQVSLPSTLPAPVGSSRCKTTLISFIASAFSCIKLMNSMILVKSADIYLEQQAPEARYICN